MDLAFICIVFKLHTGCLLISHKSALQHLYSELYRSLPDGIDMQIDFGMRCLQLTLDSSIVVEAKFNNACLYS